jgi:sugar fermentation stimulation protein A
MKNPPLFRGVLIQRYKRFLADIKLDSGETITAHCPNSGSMLNCKGPNSPVYVSISDNPKRKYPYTWELVFTNNSWVGINTNVPNKLVFDTIKDGNIPELDGYTSFRREVNYGKNSRVDILLETENKRCYVEVKSVSLARDHIACFPDAVTARGKKHLDELLDMVKEGHRAVMFFLVQREDANIFKPANDIDPLYAETLKNAYNNGVEILVYQAKVNPEEITIHKKLLFDLNDLAQK